jgi:3-keto-5-aminohexanoate cleavage enzyme
MHMRSSSAHAGIVVTAALTGPIATKADHPGLPTTPREIAAAAADAHAAGAAVVHIHVRDDEGRPSADLVAAAETLGRIGESCDALVQLSTGVGLDVPFDQRAALVELRPRMASLNVCSMTFADGEFRNPPEGVRRLAYRMGELGVKPELEVYDTGHVEVALGLAAEGLLQPPLQFSLVFGVRGGMPATPEALAHISRMLPADAVWQVVAVGRRHLPMLTLGVSMGANARTGLEDTLMLRRGELAPDNATLVTRVVEIARACGREPLAPSAAAQRLGLPEAAV